MIGKGGHYGRHYMTPCGNPPRPSVMDTLRSWAHRTFYPGVQEGRRRIIPGMPCDNHALGWSEPVYPATEGGRKAEIKKFR